MFAGYGGGGGDGRTHNKCMVRFRISALLVALEGKGDTGVYQTPNISIKIPVICLMLLYGGFPLLLIAIKKMI